jgi:hypothetical protein
MRFKFLSVAFATLILSSSLIVNSANAGLIDVVESDIWLDNTNQGFTLSTSGYSLDWLDFGITNNHSYNEIKQQLTSTYIGFRFATFNEVNTLFSTAFSNETLIPVGEGWRLDGLTIGMPNSYSTLIPIIGVNNNNFEPIFNPNVIWSSRGIIADDTGGIGELSLTGWSSCTGSCQTGTWLENKTNGIVSLDQKSQDMSWFLVRDTVDVPEPSTFIIFALGIIGLSLRRYNKQ